MTPEGAHTVHSCTVSPGGKGLGDAYLVSSRTRSHIHVWPVWSLHSGGAGHSPTSTLPLAQSPASQPHLGPQAVLNPYAPEGQPSPVPWLVWGGNPPGQILSIRVI